MDVYVLPIVCAHDADMVRVEVATRNQTWESVVRNKSTKIVQLCFWRYTPPQLRTTTEK